MFKRFLPVLLVASAPLFLMNCTDDENPNPVDPTLPDTTLQISGITETDDLGYIIGGDLTDWCYNQNKYPQGEIPTEYALYPAYPNASYYNFAIVYDLPAASDVHIAVVDADAVVIRNLVDEAQEAGRYITGWDILDSNGARAEPGFYRVTITAGDFECFGDIEVLPIPEPGSGTLIAHTEISGDQLAVSYDSPSKIAAIWLVFVFNGTVGNPVYESVAWNMNSISSIAESNTEEKPDTLKVLISTPLDELRSMPSGNYDLCRIPIVSGAVSLDYVEASDSLGTLLPTAIIKSP